MWSSIGPSRKIILSRKSREKMSYALSPNWDFSITVGINMKAVYQKKEFCKIWQYDTVSAMRLHRFYIDTPISEDKFDITDRDLVHQWRSVFRYNVGSRVILFDGAGVDYLVMITSLRSSGASVGVVEKKNKNNKPKIDLWLCVGITKKDNFELVVQKATELGVSNVVPVLCERSEKKNINIERSRKIAIESSEQSGRGSIPAVHEVVDLGSLLKSEILPEKKIFLQFGGQYIGDFLQTEKPNELAVFVGPEGGFGDMEIKEFGENNIPSISLGLQILRAETAGIAVSSLLLL